MSTSKKIATLKTAITGVVLNALTAIMGLFVQRTLIAYLGTEYSGVNGLFTNIVSILTLADLGVSGAVTFHLYRPLAENNYRKITALLNYYHKACWIIGGIIILGGIILTPFAPALVGANSIDVNLYIIFGLFVLNALFSYFLNYRRPLLMADQKGFMVNMVVMGCSLLSYGSRFLVLILTQNFYLFVVCLIATKIIEDSIVNFVVKRRYRFLDGEVARLDKPTKLDIRKKMYASVYHNAASYVVNSTDSIIITQIFGVAQLGLYTNYYMVLQSLLNLVNQIFNGMTASLGNLLATEGRQKLYLFTKRIMLLDFWIFSILGIGTYFCITPFVKMWLGSADYLLSDFVLIALVFNLFVSGMRATMNGVFGAAGVIYENRFVPVVEAIINLTSSIILALWIGLPGVFIGTVLSNLFLHFYSYPKYGFALVLKRKRIEYVILFLRYLVLFVLGWATVGGIVQFIHIDNNFWDFIVKGVLAVFVPSIVYWLVFWKSEEYHYFMELVRHFWQKKILRRS